MHTIPFCYCYLLLKPRGENNGRLSNEILLFISLPLNVKGNVYIHHVGKLARVNQKQQIILIHQPNCFKIIIFLYNNILASIENQNFLSNHFGL
jgi:hypothetical protein